MQRISIAVLVTVAVALLGAGAASAEECWEVCTPSTPCDTECGWDEGKGGPVTCGEQGLSCDPGPQTCYPNYQVVSTTPIGAFAQYFYFPFSCDHIVLYQRTHHDVNECPGSSDYTTCFYSVNASRNDHQCCVYYWCGGQTSC
jgi:hypothetical protein